MGIFSRGGVVIQWNDKPLLQELGQASEARMRAAVQYLRRQVVKSLGTPGRLLGASKPGQPPRAQTGHLRKTIFGEVTMESGPGGIRVPIGRVGTTVKYGLFLELGVAKRWTIRAKRGKMLAIPVEAINILHSQAKLIGKRGGGRVRDELTGRYVSKPRPAMIGFAEELTAELGAKEIFLQSAGRKVFVIFRKQATVGPLLPRPFLVPALERSWPTIRRILAGEGAAGGRKAG